MKAWWRRVRPYVLSGLIIVIVRLLGALLRIRTEGFEESERLGGRIYAVWHGRTLVGTRILRGRGVWAIISHSRDGEMQARIFRSFGFNIVRGSTGRGGVRAAVESIRLLRNGEVMAFTPDGPRGPTHKVQDGILVMAMKSGAAIVPVGVGAKPAWLAPTWDRYLVPLPFARALALFGDPIYVPTGADSDELDRIRTQLENEMDRLEAEAERRLGVRS